MMRWTYTNTNKNIGVTSLFLRKRWCKQLSSILTILAGSLFALLDDFGLIASPLLLKGLIFATSFATSPDRHMCPRSVHQAHAVSTACAICYYETCPIV